MAEQRLIDANALKEEIRFFSTWIMKWNSNAKIVREVLEEAKKSYLDLIEEEPTIDAVPVVHGYWKHESAWYPPECSNCGETPKTPGYIGDVGFYEKYFPHCPYCGAKMDEVTDDE